MLEQDYSAWQSVPKRLALAAAFLNADRALTARELGVIVHSHQSNVMVHLRALSGMVTETEVPRGTGARGPRPAAFLLDSKQRRWAESAVESSVSETASVADSSNVRGEGGGAGRSNQDQQKDDSAQRLHEMSAVGQLTPGQELVIVDISGGRLGDVLQALSDMSGQTAEADWVAISGDELQFAFRDVLAAASLLAVLHGAKIRVRRSTVAHVGPVAALTAEAKRAAPHVRRARISRGAHEQS